MNFLSQCVTGSILIASISLLGCQEQLTESQYLAKAQEQFSQGNLNQSLIVLKNASQNYPKSAEIRVTLGKRLLQLGDPVGAEVQFDKAIQLGYEENQLKSHLGLALLKQKQYQPLLERLESIHKDSDLPSTELALIFALKGQASLALNEIEQAQSYFDQSIDIDNDHPRALMGQAGLLMVQKQFKSARKQLKEILQSPEAGAEPWALLGDLERLQGNLEDSEKAYDQAIALSQFPSVDNQFAHLYRGLVRAFRGNFEGATEDLRIVQKGPKNAFLPYVQGIVEFKKGNYSKAQNAFEEMMKNFPTHPWTQYFLGSTHFLQGQFQLAKEKLGGFLGRYPEHQEAQLMQALTESRLSQIDSARIRLNSLLEKDPNNTSALNILGSLLMQQGELDKGLAYLQKAVQINPELSETHLRIGIGALEQGNFSLSKTALDLAIKKGSMAFQAEFIQFLALLKEKKTQQGLDFAKALQAKYPTNPLPYNLIGLAHLGMSQYDLAKESFEKALRFDIGDPSARDNLASLALKAQNVNEAKSHLIAVVEKHPKHIRSYLKLANLMLQTGDNVQTEAWLKQAIEALPNVAQPRMALARLYIQQAQYAQALDALTMSDPQEKHQLGYLAILGIAQAHNHQWTQAEKSYYKIQKHFSNARQNKLALELKALLARHDNNASLATKTYQELLEIDPSTRWVVNLVGIELSQNLPQQAISTMQTWLKKNPQDVIVRMTLANVWLKQNQNTLAEREFETILKYAPKNPLALNNLAWLIRDKSPSRAYQLAQQALELSPKNVEIQDTVNRIAAMLKTSQHS